MKSRRRSGSSSSKAGGTTSGELQLFVAAITPWESRALALRSRVRGSTRYPRSERRRTAQCVDAIPSRAVAVLPCAHRVVEHMGGKVDRNSAILFGFESLG